MPIYHVFNVGTLEGHAEEILNTTHLNKLSDDISKGMRGTKDNM